MIIITNKLKEIRENKNISLNEMAEKLAIPRVSYYKYETNERTIPNDIAYKICGILGVSYNEIFLPIRATVRIQKNQ